MPLNYIGDIDKEAIRKQIVRTKESIDKLNEELGFSFTLALVFPTEPVQQSEINFMVTGGSDEVIDYSNLGRIHECISELFSEFSVAVNLFSMHGLEESLLNNQEQLNIAQTEGFSFLSPSFLQTKIDYVRSALRSAINIENILLDESLNSQLNKMLDEKKQGKLEDRESVKRKSLPTDDADTISESGTKKVRLSEELDLSNNKKGFSK